MMPLSQVNTIARRASHFLRKLRVLLDGLRDVAVPFDIAPDGTFYGWADLSGLPAGLNSGMQSLRPTLEAQVICVPGEFFDINPGKRRSTRASRFTRYARFSFWPELAMVEKGVRRLERLVHRHGR
jgi:aspartate/methionine/tyrosine aminotransferase